jgi:hypothetical protein
VDSLDKQSSLSLVDEHKENEDKGVEVVGME